MKIRSSVAAAATAALAVGGVTLMAAPAQADLVTLCSGHGGAITLPTDLAVPAGKSCFLDGTVIQGDVTVRKGANLHILGGEIQGQVIVQQDGYFDASETTVDGRVVNRGSYGSYLEDSTAGDALRTVPVEGAANDGFAFVVDSSVKSINAETGAVYVEGSRVGGAVKGTGVEYVDIYDSVVRGALTVSGSTGGGILCDSEVLGAASYTDGAGPVAVGAGEQEGFCSSVNYIDGTLTVTGISGGAYIDNNIIGGDLAASGNTPTAQVGDNNRVRGDILTQEVALRSFSTAVTEEFEAHQEGLVEEVEAARAETVDEAMAAGPAF
ncbi:hypothetical protein ACOQFV_28700 [Nocardiopsis changdeensis]|uniref:Uncharacterized protein n=1 Tax=Nocardiopsis changdeensis TaxID=2831969 RepID=A0ABX8BPS5_9ACTN|nr:MULTISPECIES: hypothetical protein [Nocardiopsis]QUX24242.1 hypothetical protein KGD84_08075 [Nocardiopsis changdeensis]QYX34635.1 hypothetical protein K1J57_17535 [Nocardiopsis sp. MT53]